MDFKLMCFPCLRRKKKLSSFGTSSTDLDERFEYIVDKYTIRKIPLYSPVIPEDALQRQTREDFDAKLSVLHDLPLEEKDICDLTKFSILPGETYSMPRVTPILPVTTHSSRSVKEKPRPADILDSTSQVLRRPVMKPNYVVIPSKASLHTKDIMLTKREITNQYLNNFSSVFIDNLKDQVPKDPETMPKLSRPYSSSIKNISPGNLTRSSRKKSECCRAKVQKLVYALPDGNVVETGYDPEDEENSIHSNEDPIPVHSSDRNKDALETVSGPFKSVIKGPSSCSENEAGTSTEHRPQSKQTPERSVSSKQITYEDIQALDVGYDFSNSEKFGVKPKMTRIRITNLEAERAKEAAPRMGHLSMVDTEHSRRLLDSSARSSRPHSVNHGKNFNPDYPTFQDNAEDQQNKPQYLIAQECLVHTDSNVTTSVNADVSKVSKSLYERYTKEITEDSQKSDSEWEIDRRNYPFHNGNDKAELSIETDYPTSSVDLTEKVSQTFRTSKAGKSCLKNSRPNSVASERSRLYVEKSLHSHPESMTYADVPSSSYIPFKEAVMCRSRSFDSLTSTKKEDLPVITKQLPLLRFQEKGIEEQETETTNSLYSRDSKTSMVTSPVTSEPEVGKKATLRWKIIIKHNKDDSKERTSIDSQRQ